MMNPITCVCVLMAAGSGLYLFQEKQQVQMLDRQIEQVLHAADAAHARTGMLRAEYALLNDPARLQQLASQHLPALVNTAPAQFVTLAELDRRLPAVGTQAAAAPAPLEPAAPSATLPQPTVPATVSAPVAAPVAALAPPPHVAVASHAAPHPAPMAVAQATPPPRATHIASRAAAQRTASRAPAGARLAYAYRGDPYATQPATPAEAIQRIARGAPVDTSSPMVASALGMARSMMAPSPVSSATAAAFYPGGAQGR